ncbi:hypothetical protein H1R20_g9731, partial [Candolleomyces eurysporus]
MAAASPKIEKGIVIIAKFGERWDMGFTHLDRIEMQNGTNDKESGHIRDMKTRDQWPCLTISWEICEIPCEPTSSGEDTQTLLGNIKARRRQVFGPSISVSALWEAIVPPERTDLLGSLDYLGACFKRSFERTGALSDSGESISATRRAVELTPAGHPDLRVRLGNFGHSFADRFRRTGALSDTAEAVSALRRSVELTPAGHPDLPVMLNKLGILLLKRFECTGAFSNIVELTLLTRQAVELMPADHPDLPGVLSNLQNILFSILRNLLLKDSKRPGALSDIAESISVQQRAVELTPPGHPDLPHTLNNLGSSLFRRYERTGALSDIAEIISIQQQALELTPARHSTRPGMLNNLGNSFCHRSVLTRSGNDLNNSIALYMSAATCGYGPPSSRLIAARRWASLSYKHHPDSPQTLTAFDMVIQLMSLVASLDQTVQHRHAVLQNTTGLPCKAAAAGCSLGRADKALEWLEQGRCLVWTQLSNLRTLLVDLHTPNESLARRLLDVSRRLEDSGSRQGPHIDMSISEKISLEDEARVHLELANEWEELVSTVRRTVPGFENFLQSSPCSTLLQHLPDSGPIVVINVHKDRCDAIALIAGLDEPFHIPLHSFSQKKAITYSNELTAYLQLNDLRMRGVQAETDEEEDTDNEPRERAIRPSVNKKLRNQIVRNILGALWREVVKPILDALAFSRLHSSSETTLPRIWWCPTGPMSFLPLHAAGIYGGKNSDTILNYAVSSYTPSITLLADRVKNNHPVDQNVSGLFLTSQPNAPGLSPIPGVTREVRSIHKQAVEHGVRVLNLEGDDVTIDTALQHMEEFSCIHFACHASQDQNEPLQSRFRFHSGSLDLSRIIRKNLKNADLAFLSACETSTGEEKLSEEVVHLAAGMLAAGYRRVVATMWAISDGHAPEVASDLYGYLLARRVEGDGSGFNGSDSAYALHHAIQQLRERLVDDSEQSLLTWIPYVHFGF